MTRKYFHSWEPYWFCFASSGEGDDTAAMPPGGSAAAVEPPAPAASDGPASPDAAAGDGGSADSSPKPAAAPPAKPPKPDWKDKRIAELTARLARQAQSPVTPTPTPSPPAYDDEEVNRRAAHLAAINDFNNRCNETQAEGRRAFADFDGRVAAMQRLVDPNNPQETNAFNQLLDAAMQTGAGAALIHELGGDLEETQRLMGLSPVKLGVELAKRASKLENNNGDTETSAPGVDPSTIPAPLRARVNARGPSHEKIEPDDPNREASLSTAEWINRRNAQVASRRPNMPGLR